MAIFCFFWLLLRPFPRLKILTTVMKKITTLIRMMHEIGMRKA